LKSIEVELASLQISGAREFVESLSWLICQGIWLVTVCILPPYVALVFRGKKLFSSAESALDMFYNFSWMLHKGEKNENMLSRSSFSTALRSNHKDSSVCISLKCLYLGIWVWHLILMIGFCHFLLASYHLVSATLHVNPRLKSETFVYDDPKC